MNEMIGGPVENPEKLTPEAPGEDKSDEVTPTQLDDHKTSPTRVLRSPRSVEHSPIQLAPGLPSNGFALAHCDAVPAPIAQDRFAPVVPVFVSFAFRVWSANQSQPYDARNATA
jgi:hypothetical protein